MKAIIIATIMAFTITHASAQSLTCKPMPNGTTVCTPTAAPNAAGIGGAIVAIAVIYLIIKLIKGDKEEQKQEQ